MVTFVQSDHDCSMARYERDCALARQRETQLIRRSCKGLKTKGAEVVELTESPSCNSCGYSYFDNSRGSEFYRLPHENDLVVCSRCFGYAEE